MRSNNIIEDFIPPYEEPDDSLQEELKPFTTRGKAHCIPSGIDVNRRIKIDADKFIVGGRGFPANFLDKPIQSDAYYDDPDPSHETV